MIKTGRIEVGKTPSERSGRPASKIVGDQVLAKGEDPKEEADFEKIASAVENAEPEDRQKARKDRAEGE